MAETYKTLLAARNGSLIPVFQDGKAMHSLYNPEREAESFIPAVTMEYPFFFVEGLGGGYHIRALLNRYPASQIIVVEADETAITFVRSIPCVSSVLSDTRVHLFTPETLSGKLKQLYIPALHGDLQILCQRVWAEENKDCGEAIQAVLHHDLAEISADYSVQCHFGAVWQRNILLNLRLAAKAQQFCHFPTERTAAIIAAGPTFDTSVADLIRHRSTYYIIATDTAYRSLVSYGITADAVVSLDGQQVSLYHFTGTTGSSPLFIFDLCANPDAVRHAADAGRSFIFTSSGHPLASYAGDFPFLEAGAGTVTIAAADFARKAGFSSIAFFGADFSYSKGKPYTKGTYLDTLYACCSNRLSPVEKKFCTLMFRTELIPAEKKGSFTTAVLSSYRETLEVWKNKTAAAATGTFSFSFSKNDFFCRIRNDFNQMQSSPDRANPLLPALLPLISSIRYHDSTTGKSHTFQELLKLAYSKTVRYTELL